MIYVFSSNYVLCTTCYDDDLVFKAKTKYIKKFNQTSDPVGDAARVTQSINITAQCVCHCFFYYIFKEKQRLRHASGDRRNQLIHK